MSKRVEFQNMLEKILNSNNVYFQPPSSVKMKYPAIVYKISKMEARHADNRPHLKADRYQLIVIDPDPDSLIPNKILELPLCSFERHYTTENLNHDVFNIYF